MRLLPILLVVLLGCGKKDGRDCDRYAAKYAATMNPSDDAQAKMIFDTVHHDCEKGRVDLKKGNCVMKAESSDDIMRCEGLEPPPRSPP